MAVSKKHVIQRLSKHIWGIEKVVWAVTGAKRCSYAPHGIDGFIEDLHSLNLELRNGVICQTDWPTEDEFHDRYNPQGDSNGDIAVGMYLDIPECCAATFHQDVKTSHERLIEKHPFEDIGDDKHIEDYCERLTGHHRRYGFRTVRSDRIHKETVKLMDERELPKRTALLLHQYIPCTKDCSAYLEQTEKMWKALREFIPKQSGNILTRYVRKTRSWKY
ncbi:MAG: hypothetical protein V1729_01055 [Candidatus Woesearchaeota archaeon]